MAYRFAQGETAAHGIRRVALEETNSAIENLSAAEGQTPEAIHETRKSLKKVRALLRLARPQIGEALFGSLNQTFRDAGRRLSAYRDAEALVETFDGLRPGWKGLDQTLLRTVRRTLAAGKRHAQKTAEIAGHRREVAGHVGAAQHLIEKLPQLVDGFSAIEEGFEDCYRGGRKALARALKRPNIANLHELRKRVKDHWYHIRLLEDVWKDAIPSYDSALKDVEAALGENHNLALLKAELEKLPQAGELLRGIARERRALRDEAFANGRRIFEQRPRALAREMGHLWELWSARPKHPVQAKQSRKPAARAASATGDVSAGATAATV